MKTKVQVRRFTKFENNAQPQIFLNEINISPGKTHYSELRETMTSVGVDDSVSPNRQQNFYFNFTPIISKIEQDNQVIGETMTSAERTQYLSPKRQFLFKRAASQQALLCQIPRQEYQDTSDTFLTPSTTGRLHPTTIKVDQTCYKYLPQTSQKYKGIFSDNDGRVHNRQILGNEQIFRQVEQKHKQILDLRSMVTKNMSQKHAIGGNLIRNKTQTMNMQEYYTQNKSVSNENYGTVPDEVQKDLLTVRSKVFQISKTMRPNTELNGGGSQSMPLNQIETSSKQSRSKNNRGSTKFIKFPDYNAQDTITNIQDRIRFNQDSILNYANSSNTLMSTISKASTVGGILKELQQERTLRKHDHRKKDWNYQANFLNQKIFSDKKLKKASNRLKTQDEGRFTSVMMRDREFVDRMQLIRATSRLEETQHINTNVGWVFQLRSSDLDSKRNSQQYLPSTSHLSGIHAVIIPKRKQLEEVQCKQDFSSDEEKDLQNAEKKQNQLYETDSSIRVSDQIQQASKQKTNSLMKRIKSEPGEFKKWQEAWKQNQPELKKVMLGTTLEDIKALKVKGSNVLKKEIEYCMKIPNQDRIYMLRNHSEMELGEVTHSNEKEEVFAEYYELNFKYDQPCIDFEQSPNDKNKYQAFTLENGLQCLLIQDNNSKEIGKGGNLASVSIAVNVGCLNDPPKRQGLAHFLEHMIFMGSTKYPDENSFSNLICAHGGYSNAYTDMELTNYQFRVDAKGLHQALDMFAWLLKDPLLKEDAQEREIKSIESEFEVNYPYDSSRRFQLLCSNTSSKNHLLNRFTWGNIKSLKGHKPEELLKDLRAFFEEQYSADRMKLVVQMKTEDDMEEVKRSVVEIYNQIPNRGYGKQNFGITKDHKYISMPYEKNYHEMILFNGVKNQNQLYLLFTLPSEREKKKVQLAFYLISQILGHEGKGSLYQDLKEKSLILRIKASEDYQYKTLMNGFEISFTLTEKGMQEYQSVIAALFRYLDLIIEKLSNTQNFNDFELFKESRIMSLIGFKYFKIPEPLDNVCELASEMIYTQDISKVVRDTYEEQVIDELEIPYILEKIRSMTLKTCKIVLNGKNFLESEKIKDIMSHKTKIESWFKTKYAIVQKDEKSIQNLISLYDTSKIQLPSQNLFIPEDFTIKSSEKLDKNQIPKLLAKDDQLYELWLHQDHTFRMPRSLVQIIFILPQLFDSPQRRGYFAVYLEALIEKVTSLVGFEAVLADVQYSVKVFENLGYKLKFSGYNDKLMNFIDIFLKIMYDTHLYGFEEWQLKLSVEKQLKSYKNLNVEVDQRNTNNRLIFLLDNQYHASLVIKELEAFSIHDFNTSFVGNTLLKEICYFKLFAAGNITEQEVYQVGQLVQDRLGLVKRDDQVWRQEGYTTKVRKIRDEETLIWDCIHESGNGNTKEDGEHSEDCDEDDDQSMEDLTGEVHQECSSDKEDVSSSEEGSQDEEGSNQQEKTEGNSCISMYFQSKDHSVLTGVCMQLLEQILDERFYDELRNKEQCGYYVAATRRQTRGIYGFLFTIESAIYNPLQLQEKITKFIQETYDKLVKEPEIITNFHQGLLAKKKEGFKDIREEAGYLFSQMKDFNEEPQEILWNKLEVELQVLEKEIKTDLILDIYKTILIENPRLALFRAFAPKCKEEAKNFEIEEQVKTGEYRVKNLNKECIYEMHLNV